MQTSADEIDSCHHREVDLEEEARVALQEKDSAVRRQRHVEVVHAVKVVAVDHLCDVGEHAIVCKRRVDLMPSAMGDERFDPARARTACE
jgi:hypothetical protein